MNCLEFRRVLGVDPASAAPAFLAHRDACVRCAGALLRAHAFERELERALQVPVPDALAEQVLLAQTTAVRHGGDAPLVAHASASDRARTGPTLRGPMPHRALGPARGWRTAAAWVLMLGGAGLGYGAWQASRPLSAHAIAHLAHEPHALAARGDIPGARITDAFRRAGAVLVDAPARVDYLQNCDVAGDPTVHLVVQRPEGPVTVLYVVDDATTPRGEFAQRGLKGRTVPLDRGTLVLIASEADSFDLLEREWRRAIAGFGDDIAHAAP